MKRNTKATILSLATVVSVAFGCTLPARAEAEDIIIQALLSSGGIDISSQTFNGSAGDNTIDIATGELPAGPNLVTFRVKDSDSNYSTTYSRLIYIVERMEVSAMEYFIDTDPGIGQASPVTNPGNSTVSFSVPTDNLSSGDHSITVRGKIKATGPWIDFFVSAFTVKTTGGIASVEWGQDLTVTRTDERISMTFTGETHSPCQVKVHSLNGTLIYSGVADGSFRQLSIDAPASVSPVIISVQWPDKKRSVRTIR